MTRNFFFTAHDRFPRPQPRQQRRAANHRSLSSQHRFGLGDGLLGHLSHLLEQLVLARYARANLHLDALVHRLAALPGIGAYLR